MDFAIIYENKTREFETAYIIKELLNSQGFKAKVFSEYSIRRFFSNPKALIVPYLYKTEDVYHFNSFLFNKKRPVINLQYEQVLSNMVREASFHEPKGEAQKAAYIFWGEKEISDLLSSNSMCLDINHIFLTGNISMILDDPHFKSCFVSRNDLSKKYDIPAQTHWHLFISSFTYPTLSKSEISVIKQKISGIGPFIDYSAESRNSLLSWFHMYCEQHKDTIIIYRPHPNEYEDESLKRMENRHSNFRVIRDYSIRQWIIVSDSLSTWFSTSIVDAYFAHKSCMVLRPVPIPEHFEVDILKGCQNISCFEEYEQAMSGETVEFPINKKTIENMYDNIDYNHVCERFMNCCRKVLASPVDYQVMKTNTNILKELILNLVASIFGLLGFNIRDGKYSEFINKQVANKYCSKRLGAEYEKRFKGIFSK